MSMNEPVLIVGQGLAGTILSYQLRKRGVVHSVLDNGNKASSSRIAAGMWNPVVFRRMNLSWKAHEVLSVLNSTYKDLELILSQKFLYPKRIIKVFPNEQFADLFKSRLNDPEFKGLLSLGDVEDLPENEFDHLGCGIVHQGGYVDLGLLLDSWRDLLVEQNALIQDEFLPSLLLLNDRKVIYNDQPYSKVIFCEGHKIDANPWFSYLPMKHVKGEVLSVHSEYLGYEDIINHNHFLLPLGDGNYKIGATYDWENLNTEITDVAKNNLLKGMNSFLKSDYEITNHQAGIRPSVSDRRPLLGLHPKHPSLGIFNGFGTKGVMLAPYCADHLVQHLIDDRALDNEMDIGRFGNYNR